MLERHPPHVRKRIALIITAVIAVGLVGLFALMLTQSSAAGSSNAGSRFKDFYKTILDHTQSYIDEK